MAALLAVAVVYVARPDTASGGALPPLKIVPDSRTLRRRSPDSPPCTLECPAEALLRTFQVIVPASRTLRRRSPDSPLCTLECPAEALLRTFKVLVLDSRTLQTSPQSRPNLLRPRAPLALAQPSRLLLPCVMVLRFRVTPTQTSADQVRSRCHLLLLRDGSTTVPHRYPCLRHYPTDAPLLLQLTPTHRYLILDRYCDRATPPLTPELAASDGNDPPTGTSIQRCGDTGTSDTDIRVLCPSRDRPPPRTCYHERGFLWVQCRLGQLA